MRTVSIGYYREDGDFAILATLNNNDDWLSQEDFDALIQHVIAAQSSDNVIALEREDAPDYVSIG